jgi:hypothetical protein
VADQGRALRRKDDRYHIEPQRAIWEFVSAQKALCGSDDFFLLLEVYGRYGRCVILAATGFNFHKDYRSALIGGNQVNLASAKSIVSRDGSASLSAQKSLRLALAPSAQTLRIRQQTAATPEHQHNGGPFC